MPETSPKIMFFPYFGPNRRCDVRVVELRLEFGPDDAIIRPQNTDQIRQLLQTVGLETSDTDFVNKGDTTSRHSRFVHLVAQIALLAQRYNGHRVNFYTVINDPDKKYDIVLVEHESAEVGMAAIKLAIEIASGRTESFTQEYHSFSKKARGHLLPLETHTIIKLAKQRRIPVFQLEREPLTGHFNTGFRVRPNGLLILGYGKNRHVLDGTFCVNRADERLRALLQNPGQRLSLLESHGFITTSHKQHVLAEGRIPDSKSTAAHNNYQLLVTSRKIMAFEQTDDGAMRAIDNVHESVIHHCQSLYTDTGCAALSISLKAASLSVPLAESNATALDFDPAPDLQQYLGNCLDCSHLIDSAVSEILDWLFPTPEASRIPVIAVTGSNGKTTTSRMIDHILQTAGHQSGLVCTDGIFIDGQSVNEADASTFLGHARVLTSPKVSATVLETHHRGIAVRGFAFDDCNVAICLNVTEEHLEKGGIETLEEMTTIKRALLERARQVAVLFADDDRCQSMIGHLQAQKICLVSLQSSSTELGKLLPMNQASFCVLETVKNESWIVLYDQQQRIQVMPVNQIPATFDGCARFNISNAMHALAACYFSGTDVRSIRLALSGFYAGEKFTPGRMNEIEGLPFRVIIDFAHNPDGMKQVCEFADRTQIPGRKILAFAVAINRTDDANAKVAKAAAGHFDFYFCKDYQPAAGDLRRYMGPFIQQVLIDEGVSAHQTTVTTFGKEAIYTILDACKPGDLLILLLGHVEKQIVPAYIGDYADQYGVKK